MHGEDRYPLTDFAAHTNDHITRLRASGEPEILTVGGEAEVVVQNAAAYQLLLDRLDSLEAVAAVKESMAEYARGEGVSAREGLNSLREKHGIPRNT